MKIIYVAKHGSGGNDDEGAVAHALEVLGHQVVRIQESRSAEAIRAHGDFVLFHKWADFGTMRYISQRLPLVFWYFDLVDCEDPSLRSRCFARRSWMEEVTPIITVGFCTDGDWVAKDRSGKLVWLMQGADERITSFNPHPGSAYPLLITASRNSGWRRANFIQRMEGLYGSKLVVIERGFYGSALADKVANASIVLAPDYPVSDRYWSNRVYLMGGFGAFLLHPWSEGLRDQYSALQVPMYLDDKNIYSLIESYLDQPAEREVIRREFHEATQAHHLYIHRVAHLLTIVKERCSL